MHAPAPTIWGHVATVLDGERRRRGLSIRDVADRADVDESTVRRMLRADPVRLASLRAVSASLGLGWADLLAALSDPPRPTPVQVSGSHR